MNKFIALDSLLFQQLWGNIFSLMFVFFQQQVRTSAWTDFLGTAQWPIPVSSTISLSHIDSPWQAIWSFLCVSLYRQFAGNQFGLSAHVGTSIYMQKSCVDMWSRDSSLTKYSITAHCQNNTYSLAIFLQWNMTRWHDFHSGVRKQMEVITTYYTSQHCLACVCNSTMLVTFPAVFMYTQQTVTGWSTRHRLCVKQQKHSD
jgi:hypothetical protein